MSTDNELKKIACFGGVYNNYLSLEAAIADARSRGVNRMYCLGDLGAFGPHPDRVFPLIHDHNVLCIQGNYDDSIGNQLNDCQCGYTDPRDNHFAQISYDYTLANTSPVNREFLKSLPKHRRLQLGPLKVLLCHGSPRKVNEFLWQSTCSSHYLSALLSEAKVDVIVATHTGIKWKREVEGGVFINAGVLGRPENDGSTNVWYTLLEYDVANSKLLVEFVPVSYDHRRLAQEMREENLPEEFVETVLSGWWTTCLEVLPAKERLCGVH